ncbi:unnamed protein product [Rotaria sordida]|uniref:Uncharacterized protein n=1 Tax=Rotaria sordida TaxID=392033 RepID=A0A814FJ08_9BILA|nr:unnamed protein product [Rotaria sordida]
MNGILTGLRNRLTTEHLEKLMRISIEGPADLDDDIKNIIIDNWKNVESCLTLVANITVRPLMTVIDSNS